MSISVLRGKTLSEIRKYSNAEIQFDVVGGPTYAMRHMQECCEDVLIEDVCGDLNDLVGSPITLAEESSNQSDPPLDAAYPPARYTWTFYRLATVRGYVTIRWYGTSNGYYSEGVDFYEIDRSDSESPIDKPPS